MKPIPLVRRAVLAPAISYLVSEGVPVARHLRRANLSAPRPETLESVMPLHQLCDFLHSVARAEGMHDLGFHIGGHLGIESLGAYGKLAAKAFTLHETILFGREMISSYNSGLEIWMERHGNQVKYCQKNAETLAPDRAIEISHLGLKNALALAGLARGSDWRPTRIELATGPIDLGVYYPDLAETPVSFNHPQTSFWFDHVWLSKPLPSLASPLFPTANDEDRGSFLATAPSDEPVGQLEQVIESSLEHPNFGLHFTAAIIGTSPRSMQRHLGEHDLSFSRLLQAVRFRTAQRLLRDRGMPLSEVARRLGYSELANFTHAFKRWTGVGPNKFRQLHDGDL